MGRSDLQFDYENCLAEQIGTAGLTLKQIEGAAKTTSSALTGLKNLRKLGQLPFWDLPKQDEDLQKIIRVADEKAGEFNHFILIGIGGSSLGPEVLIRALAHSSPKKFYLVDHLDSDRLQRVMDEIDPKKTCLVIVSKSGNTYESLASFLIVRDFLKKELGIGYRRHVVVITDPIQGPLRKMVAEEKLESFSIPSGVGGRFSVLTAVGLFPAAFFGIDVEDLVAGARAMDETSQRDDLLENSPALSATLHYLFATKKGRGLRVMMTYHEALHSYGDWFAQLWAESLGKKMSLKGKIIMAGSTPIPAEGVRDQHSQLQLYLEGPQDKVVNFVTVDRGANLLIPKAPASLGERGRQLEGKGLGDLLKIEQEATISALVEEKRPCLAIRIPEVSAYTLGQLFMMAEIETAIAGALWGINPFDQPAVEIIKKYIQRDLLS